MTLPEAVPDARQGAATFQSAHNSKGDKTMSKRQRQFDPRNLFSNRSFSVFTEPGLNSRGPNEFIR